MGRKPQQRNKQDKPIKGTRSARRWHSAGLIVYGVCFAMLGAGIVLLNGQQFEQQTNRKQAILDGNDLNLRGQSAAEKTDTMVVAPVEPTQPLPQALNELKSQAATQPPPLPQGTFNTDARQEVGNTDARQQVGVGEPDGIPDRSELPNAQSVRDTGGVVQPVRRVQPGSQYDPSWRTQTTEPDVPRLNTSARDRVAVVSDAAPGSVPTAQRVFIPLPTRNPTRGGRSRRHANAGRALAGRPTGNEKGNEMSARLEQDLTRVVGDIPAASVSTVPEPSRIVTGQQNAPGVISTSKPVTIIAVKQIPLVPSPTVPEPPPSANGIRSNVIGPIEKDLEVSGPQKIPPPNRNPTRSSTSASLKQSPSSALSESAKPAIPPPDVWSSDQIDVALARCKIILARIDAVAKPHAPVKLGPCGTAAPIRLTSIGANPPVQISPPAIVNCEFAQALHSWVAAKLQPAARKHLGKPVTAIKTLASYACRKRYGRKTGKISEHAKANALDIGSFQIEGGAKVSVLSSWGVTLDDIAKQEAADLARRQAKELAEKQAKSQQRLIAGNGEVQAKKTSALAASPVAQVALVKVESKRPKPGRLRQFDDSAAPPRTRFLHDIHSGACGVFGTVLGPEANDAHRNHFHFDLIERRRRAYCE